MRILIIGEDLQRRNSLGAMASELGHECIVAAESTSASDMLALGGFDVLLTDWPIHSVDAPELCSRVRSVIKDGYVYTILVTTLGEPDRVLEGLDGGVDDCIVAPVDPFTLQARLAAAERFTALRRKLVEVTEQLDAAMAAALEHSLVDDLTGLGNRRRMEEDLADTHSRAMRVLRPYGVVLFDIDYFKAYNDHYGHHAGDQVLRRVAHRFVSVSRAGERLYRVGGEQFALLLTEASLEGATAAAERLRAAIVDLAAPHDFRETPPAIVTLSGGVACWDPESILPTDVLHRAEEALSVAKSDGRNRVMAADGGDFNLATPSPALLR